MQIWCSGRCYVQGFIKSCSCSLTYLVVPVQAYTSEISNQQHQALGISMVRYLVLKLHLFLGIWHVVLELCFFVFVDLAWFQGCGKSLMVWVQLSNSATVFILYIQEEKGRTYSKALRILVDRLVPAGVLLSSSVLL
jgi:hypothetical protein